MQDPLAILAILCLNIVICEWLNRHTFLRHLGTTLLVILLTAVVANLGIIPSASDASPLYGGIFKYVAPISIFFLLLGVNLSHLKDSGLSMLLLFGLGAIGTALGALLAVYLVDAPTSLGENYKALAGMMTGTYTGGSVNFNAIALHYEVTEEGTLYAGLVAVDNILTAIWMICSIALPKLLQNWLPRKLSSQGKELSAQEILEINNEEESMDPMQLALLITMALATLWVSNLLADRLQIPAILILTTIALILAQFPYVQRLGGAKLLGLFTVYLFLAVIGAFCELAALSQIGALAAVLVLFTTTIVVVHGLIIFLIGALFKQDWFLISVASQANIGGASSAMALAKSLHRTDLILPSILVGTLGSGLGTYLGFLVAEVLL